MALFVDYASVDGNQPPDIEKAMGFGIRGAIVRAGYTAGGLALPDSHCGRDAAAWRAAGCKFGAYMILGWRAPDVEKQVARFIQTYQPAPGDLPPSLDLEADSAAKLGMTPRECLDRAEAAYALLHGHYGDVMVYTSARVWTDVFGDLPSAMGASPLWLKVAYWWRAGNTPHVESEDKAPVVLPPPWRGQTPGMVLKQFQGDARAVPGFTNTVDLNEVPPGSPLLP